MKKYSRCFRRSMELMSALIIGGMEVLLASEQTLPKRVVADSSLAWEADGAQADGSWEYGYYASGSDASTFTHSSVWRSYYGGPNSWIGALGEIWDSGGYPRLGKYAIAPSPTQMVVRRWTSNYQGEVSLLIDCQQLQDSLNNQDFRLYRNGVLEQVFQKNENSHHLIFSETCTVAVGDQLDFVIDSLGNANADWTHVAIRISTDPPCSDALFYFPLDEVQDLPTGWVAHGPLYDRRSRVGDYSGNDNHAVLVDMDRNLASLEGVHDRARFFDGSNDYLKLEKQNLGDGLGEITLAAWVKPTSKGDNEGILTSTGPDYQGLLISGYGTGNPIEFRTKGQFLVGPDDSCPVDEWTHVVGVWKSGQVQKLYLNGEQVASHASPPTGILDLNDWLVGSDRNISNRFYHGALDDLHVLPRALKNEEVRDLYRRHAAIPTAVGSALYYDREGDLTIREAGAEQGATELTLSAWINPYRKEDNDALVSSTGNDFFGLLLSGYGQGNPIEFRAKSARITGSDYTCPTGQWNHIAGVWKSGQIQKLYLNGVEIGDNPNPPTGIIDIHQWFIGRDRDFSNRHYHGLLSGLQIIDQALDVQGVAALYQQNLPAGHSATGSVEMQGHLRWDYGFGFVHSNTEELVADPNYLSNPAGGKQTGFIPASSTGRMRNQDSVSRLRGYLTAPDTGEYFLWLSSRTAADLSLSPDDQKYTKRRIARLSPTDGTATGVGSEWPNRWDSFVAQMSDPISLQAGERYYLDVLQTSNSTTDGHIALAWARPNGAREPIPTEFLTPYVQELEDIDDDFLPDQWETQYGLDPTDNGANDTSRQGEYGDYDNDGLKNREEYLLGTDPTNPDTDGDGLSDLAEQNVHGTDPTTSDAPPESILTSLDLQTVNGFGDTWIETGSGGVLAANFRGTATFDFNVPSDGHWIVQLEAKLRGDLRLDEILPVKLAINGKTVESTQIEFHNDLPGAIRTVTPWLPAGNHSFGLFIDNYTTRRSLEITSLKIIIPGGLDADSNGNPDWLDAELTQRSQVLPHDLYTYTSPAFIEGHSPSDQLVDLTTITRSGQTNRLNRFTQAQWDRMTPIFNDRVIRLADRLQTSMRRVLQHPTWHHHNDGRMEGTAASHHPGPGNTKWFTGLPLNPNEAIGYITQLENLGTYHTGTIAWIPANILDTSLNNLTIPVGSKLLLGAWIQDWDWQTITLTIDGGNLTTPVTQTFPSTQSYIHHFTDAGAYTLNASHPGGQTHTVTLDVRTADLPADVILGEQRFRTVTLPEVESDLALDAGGTIHHDPLQTATPAGSTVRFGGQFPGVYRTAARLSATESILDQKETHVVGVSDALRNASDTIIPQGGDLFLVRSPLLVTHLPVSATIDIVVFAGGVTFPDGTTTKTLTVNDLDEHGVITLEFLMPQERLGAPCHYINIYDHQGVKVWNSTN